MIDELVKEFRNRFQKSPERIFFCPGRVNLIGEHIDYNGGRVMPCAISPGVWLAVSKNIKKELSFHCLNFPETAELHLQTSYSRSGSEWFNYPLGIINHFAENEMPVSGMEMLFSGNLPIGAGLSSSASIEVLTAFAISEMFGLNISKTEIALLSKKMENEFIGVNCGIMDQFAVAMGKKDKAILLDCDTLDYEYLPLYLGEYALVIINSNKTRKLTESKYNERFTECGRILKALKKELPVLHLCDISMDDFFTHRHLINDPVLERRALHVISENSRVEEAVDVLRAGELLKFGQLLYASHGSLKELYEVSGKELDTIVDFCKSFDGCIGARMTGAGFGGCVIALVKKNELDEFKPGISSYFENNIGYKPEVFVSEIGEGVKELS
jgi:galactokinase